MKFRKPLKITSRSSSITNAFVQAIVPWSEPTPEQRKEALAVLKIDPDDVVCAYCGQRATDWDHLRPLVKSKRPSGYVSDYKNLVPSCAPCNQSKSGADWRSWVAGSAAGSPRTRNIKDLDERISRLEAFEAWSDVSAVDVSTVVDMELWDQYWLELETIKSLLANSQKIADRLSKQIANAAKIRSDEV